MIDKIIDFFFQYRLFIFGFLVGRFVRFLVFKGKEIF